MASAKPTQPPTADMTGLIAQVDKLSKKVFGTGFTSTLPAWKRWVGGEAEFDVKGLRDVVNSHAIMLDNMKQDVDASAQAILELRADVEALKEAPPARPFP